jgi:hypothetical protein
MKNASNARPTSRPSRIASSFWRAYSLNQYVHLGELGHHHHHHHNHHQVDAWVAEKRDGGTLSTDEERELLRLGEEARAIVGRATDIVINCTEQLPPPTHTHLLQARGGQPTN